MNSWLVSEIKRQFWPICVFLFTLVFCLITSWMLILPAYKDPSSRMYTSRLGYSTVLRKTERPFDVFSAKVKTREIEAVFLGEGLVLSQSVQVPMIAMAKIESVLAQPGDRVKKGQKLVQLDTSRIELKIDAAKAALETTKAERERVRFGSVNILLDERPDLDKIQLEAAENSAKSEKKILDRMKSLYDQDVVMEKEYLRQKIRAKDAEVYHRKLIRSAKAAEIGKSNSIRIADSTVKEAEMAWRHRLAQKTDYVSYAPADGIVERVLVYEGEYNQDPGRPAMLLASGLWFEANLDQTYLGQIDVGNKVDVRLAAFQDCVVQGVVTRILPLVNFSLGGPETNRPIRPLGTGAPEWPATFGVRISLDNPGKLPLVPGLTGFAKISNQRTSVCVPRGTVSSTSGNRGIVFVVNQKGDRCYPRNVTFGWEDLHWTEILEGLEEGEVVVADGYQVLEPGDAIKCLPLPKKK